MIIDWLLFLFAGSFAGIMAGFFGVGGGTVIVPILSLIFIEHMHVSSNVVMHMAAGTSLCIMIFTSASAVRAHILNGSRAWMYFRKLLVVNIVGIILGAMLADILPTNTLKLIFGCFILLVAIDMQFNLLRVSQKLSFSVARDRKVMVIVGLLSGLLGIGGGTLMIPYFSQCKMPLRKITSLAALSSLTAGLCGTIMVVITGLNNTEHLAWSTGYVYWPAVLFAAFPSILFAKLSTGWAYKLPVKHLKLFFIIFLFIVGIKMVS